MGLQPEITKAVIFLQNILDEEYKDRFLVRPIYPFSGLLKNVQVLCVFHKDGTVREGKYRTDGSVYLVIPQHRFPFVDMLMAVNEVPQKQPSQLEEELMFMQKVLLLHGYVGMRYIGNSL